MIELGKILKGLVATKCMQGTQQCFLVVMGESWRLEMKAHTHTHTLL